MKKLWNGVQVPEVGDDVLGSLEKMATSISNIYCVNSPVEARQLVGEAIGAGVNVSRKNPLYFNIYGRIYTSEGSGVNGFYDLVPLNEPQFNEVSMTAYRGYPLPNQGDRYELLRSTLQTSHFDRFVTATTFLYAGVTGIVDLWMTINGKEVRSRFGASGSTTSLTLSGIVPANTTPYIAVGVEAAISGCSVMVSQDARWQGLQVLAHPCGMYAAG